MAHFKTKRADTRAGDARSLGNVAPTGILDLLDNSGQHSFQDDRRAGNNKALLGRLIGQFPKQDGLTASALTKKHGRALLAAGPGIETRKQSIKHKFPAHKVRWPVSKRRREDRVLNHRGSPFLFSYFSYLSTTCGNASISPLLNPNNIRLRQPLLLDKRDSIPREVRHAAVLLYIAVA